MHAYEMHAYEIHAQKTHPHGMHAHEIHDAGKVSFVPKLPYVSAWLRKLRDKTRISLFTKPGD
jgi:hypothetical protein